MADKKTRVIKAGHLGYQTAMFLEMKAVPVVWLEDLTDEQLNAYMMMENELSEMGEWNRQNVQAVLEKIPKFEFKKFNMNFQKFEGMKITIENSFLMSASLDESPHIR